MSTPEHQNAAIYTCASNFLHTML